MAFVVAGNSTPYGAIVDRPAPAVDVGVVGVGLVDFERITDVWQRVGATLVVARKARNSGTHNRVTTRAPTDFSKSATGTKLTYQPDIDGRRPTANITISQQKLS